jgi:hypothetical protein
LQTTQHKREALLFSLIAAATLVLRAVCFFRYRFDSDEPQHLHVAWGWTAGLLQYRDLFDNHAPLFHMASAPLLKLVGERSDVLLFMRAPMLLLFAIVVYVTYVVAAQLYDRRVAAWSALMLALLPPFFLKSLEYRTDNLWNAFWMLAVLVLISGALTPLRLFLAGVILGFAFAVSMKTSLLILTIGIAALTTYVMNLRGRSIGRPLRVAIPLLLGVPIVPAIIAWYFVAHGAWPNLVYCVVKFNEGVALTRTPFVLWTPRILYIPLFIVTMRIAWRYRDANTRRFFFAVATAIFFITLICFWVLISPRDYLPFLPFLAIFCVAALERRAWLMRGCVAASILFVAFIVKETRGFHDATLKDITMWNQVLRLTRPGDYIIDFKGETIFRPRPYYFIFELIGRNQMLRGMIADTVPEDVVAKRCYVAQADGEFWPPRARSFLSANFVDLGRLRAAGQWLKPDGSFTIAVPGNYVMLDRSGEATGVLDGRPYAGARPLAPGPHRFAANTSGRVAVLWAPAYERGFTPFRLQDRDF